MKYKVLIVEDEHLAVAELKRLLQAHQEIEVLGVAGNVQDAVKSVNELNPQFIFLDINLHGQSGFELLETLDHVPPVIFITAYDQYAIKAFEVNAIDYLLKPLHPQRLAGAIVKIKNLLNSRLTGVNQLHIDKRIFIKDGELCYFVPLADIFLIESIGNYARVYFSGNKPMIHKSLNYLEEKLPGDYFFRASRQYIININFIKNIVPFFNNTLQVELKSGDKIDISQRQSIRFKELMGL